MLGINYRADAALRSELFTVVGRSESAFKKELKKAVKQAAKKCVGKMAKQIVETVTLTQAVIKKKTKVTVSPNDPIAEVELSKSDRMGLQYYKARQTKQGVSYKISKTEGRKTAAGAFMGPRPGVLAPKLYGGVFMRQEGEKRLPIFKREGPSPWGVYVKNSYQDANVEFTREELRKQIKERIRELKLRKSGVIKNTMKNFKKK